jgi:hypothetical protein
VDRLRQIMSLQRRLRDLEASPRAQRALVQRSMFREALTWLEIHGSAPELVAHWTALLGEQAEPPVPAEGESETPPLRRRRRRRRRRFRPVPTE